MKVYANRGGNSNVKRYRYGEGYIVVEFGDNSQYEYTEGSAGLANVTEMQKLADEGLGLNAYIMEYTKDRYAKKLD